MSRSALELDHVALPVYDAEASLRFYAELLELPLLAAHAGDDWGGKPWLMMIFELGDGRQLALCALREAERPAEGELPKETRHLAFSLASAAELTAWQQRLARAGIAAHEEDHGTQRSLYFEDPNGHVLELTSPRSLTIATRDAQAADVVARWLSEHGSSVANS